MGVLILMVRPTLDDLPPVVLPHDMRLATAAEFDDPRPMWADLINRSFADQSWTVDYIQQNYTSQAQYDPAGVFFVMRGDQAVSTAFGWRDQPGDTESGRVHWVGTLPECRGLGLGRAVVLAVMHYLRDQGFSKAHLETHPPLLPAISLYMALGMEPTPRNAEEEQAWAGVFEELAKHKR